MKDTPYRALAERIPTRRLPEDKHNSIVEVITSNNFNNLNSMPRMLEVIGYEERSKGIYIRENKHLPSFPDGEVLVPDRFVAIPPTKLEENGVGMLVSGSYNGDLAEINDNLETILRIDSDLEIYQKKSYKGGWLTYSTFTGTALLIDMLYTTSWPFWIAPILMATASVTYVIDKLKKTPQKIIKGAGNLSSSAKDYLFGYDAYREIIEEYRVTSTAKKRLQMREKLDNNGIHTTPEEFLKLTKSIHTHEYFRDGDCIFPGIFVLDLNNGLMNVEEMTGLLDRAGKTIDDVVKVFEEDNPAVFKKKLKVGEDVCAEIESEFDNLKVTSLVSRR